MARSVRWRRQSWVLLTETGFGPGESNAMGTGCAPLCVSSPALRTRATAGWGGAAFPSSSPSCRVGWPAHHLPTLRGSQTRVRRRAPRLPCDSVPSGAPQGTAAPRCGLQEGGSFCFGRKNPPLKHDKDQPGMKENGKQSHCATSAFTGLYQLLSGELGDSTEADGHFCLAGTHQKWQV